MYKKLDIEEKVKQLLEEKRDDSPILKPRNAEKIKETKPLLWPGQLSIKDLAIPVSVDELFSMEITVDFTETEELIQLLSLRENPEVKLKWTVQRDPYMEELDWLKKQGLVQARNDLPVYSRELDEGTLIVSHIGDYTFSFASYDLKIDKMLEIFTSLIEYVAEIVDAETGDISYQEMGELLNAKIAEVEHLKRQLEEVTRAYKKSDILYRESDELLNAKTIEVNELKRQLEELMGGH